MHFAVRQHIRSNLKGVDPIGKKCGIHTITIKGRAYTMYRLRDTASGALVDFLDDTTKKDRAPKTGTAQLIDALKQELAPHVPAFHVDAADEADFPSRHPSGLPFTPANDKIADWQKTNGVKTSMRKARATAEAKAFEKTTAIEKDGEAKAKAAASVAPKVPAKKPAAKKGK